ncbi:hypothetical protein GCM10023223_33180 [Stackebrandtia albiflava]
MTHAARRNTEPAENAAMAAPNTLTTMWTVDITDHSFGESAPPRGSCRRESHRGLHLFDTAHRAAVTGPW